MFLKMLFFLYQYHGIVLFLVVYMVVFLNMHNGITLLF